MRWDVPDCVEACIQSLYDCTPVHDIFVVQAACPDAGLNNLVDLAARTLLCEFEDAPSMLQDAPKLKHLTDMPLVAMSALLQCSFLKTDAEASVLLLLRAWYEANRASCSFEQLQALKMGVRYSRLSVEFICGVLPHLPDFCLTPKQTHELWLSRTMGHHEAELLKHLGVGGACPVGWYLPERSIMNYKCLTLELKIPQSELVRHVAAVVKMQGKGRAPAAISSQRVFGYGYYWTLSLSSASRAEALKLNLEMHSPIEGGACMMLSCAVKFHLPGEEDEGEEEDAEDSFISTAVPVSVSDVLGTDLSAQWWRNFVVGGCLCFSADISIPRK